MKNPKTDEGELAQIEEWLASYKIGELLEDALGIKPVELKANKEATND